MYTFQNLTAGEENWKEIREVLPVELHRGLVFENGCWTFYDDPRGIKNGVPLRIAKALVIVPIYTPPFGRPENESPPDPYPGRIDPFAKATDDVICSLLETFDFALGFYILYNGHLQIWASGGDSFDRQLAASRYPRRFGGLKVSYFTGGPRATSSIAGTSHQGLVHTSTNDSQPIAVRPPFECGSEIAIRTQSQRSRIGVALEMQDISGNGTLTTYVTMATHPAIAQSKQKRSLWKSLTNRFSWRDKIRPQDSSGSWWEGMEVYETRTNARLGNLSHSFDPDPSARFPIGFPQDISLVKPDDSVRIEDIHCPATEWYTENGQNTRDTVYILGPGPRVEGHALPQVWGERIGEGIMRIQKKWPRGDRWNASKRRVEDLVDRCYLWRPLNEFNESDAWSGAPVILRRDDGTQMLLGFQSFIQPTNLDLRSQPDETQLRNQCGQGYISFAACMKPGNELLNSKIL
ncbi:hypothetical protein BDD12DRAFT_473649 [Trichophaea hybrida]|nr:hypothetical protein BDD12DRAFT_473649 [Trichophaea hybrida]